MELEDPSKEMFEWLYKHVGKFDRTGPTYILGFGWKFEYLGNFRWNAVIDDEAKYIKFVLIWG